MYVGNIYHIYLFEFWPFSKVSGGKTKWSRRLNCPNKPRCCFWAPQARHWHQGQRVFVPKKAKISIFSQYSLSFRCFLYWSTSDQVRNGDQLLYNMAESPFSLPVRPVKSFKAAFLFSSSRGRFHQLPPDHLRSSSHFYTESQRHCVELVSKSGSQR